MASEWSAGETGFLRVLEVDAGEAARHADAFDRVGAGELQAIVVRGVYPSGLLEPIVERLERHDPPFLQTWFPERFRSWFFGANLNLTGPGLEEYFAASAGFHAQLRALFPGELGLIERVGAVLASLDHGRTFVAPPGPRAGQQYMFTTLRAHMEGGYIPPHFDNEQTLRPSYAHLRGLVEPHMTSFVLTLARAEAGGALEVFDSLCEPEDARLISADGAARPLVEGLPSTAFRIPAGDLIVLDSGRYLHRLTPVEGASKRWTACSFMARARAGGATYCWG